MTDIQWDQPLEAVHEDGRVAEVTVTSDWRDDFILASMPHEFFTYFNRVDGTPRRPERYSAEADTVVAFAAHPSPSRAWSER
jgi:hypothetical protein